MGNVTNVQVEIFNGSDVSQGTIDGDKLLSFKTKAMLSGIGKGEFVVALDDTESTALVTRNAIAVLSLDTTRISGIIVQAFIIQEIKQDILASGRAVLRVSGADMLYEWTYTNLGYTVIDDGAGGEISNIVDNIVTNFDPGIGGGWGHTNFHFSAGQGDGYHVPSAETAWQAISQLGGARGIYYSLGLNDASYSGVGIPDRRIIEWGSFQVTNSPPPASVFDTMILMLAPSATGERPILDGTFRIINEPSEVVTRVYVYGAGQGNDRFTLADKTDADPTGFTTTAADSLIVNTTLEAVSDQPQITRVTHFSSIKPEDISDATMRATAANQLLQAGVSYLTERDGSNKVYYQMDTLPDGRHIPGQLVTLTYTRTSPWDSAGAEIDTDIISISDTFLLLEYSTTMDSNNNWVATVLLGDVPELPEQGDSMTAKRIVKLEETLRHSTSGQSSPTKPVDGDTYLKSAGSPPNLTGNMVVDAGITIDTVDISAANAQSFLMVNASSEHEFERSVNFSADFTITDNGANSTYDIDLNAGSGALHDALTLGTNASAFLELTGQLLGLDTQTANTGFFGPTTGVAADPAFRAMVFADVPTDSDPTGEAVLASDSNGRLGLEGLGILTAPDGDYIKITSGVTAIGLANSGAARLEFTNAVTDLLELHDGNFNLVNSGVTKLQLRFGGDVSATESDIYAADAMGLAADDDIAVFIDASNGSTARSFKVMKDAEDVASATELMRVNESGELLLGATGNSGTTVGVTINQANLDDEALALQDSTQIATGHTAFTKTETYGRLLKWVGASGGLRVEGFTEASGGLVLIGRATNEVTTDTSASTGNVILRAALKSGVSSTTHGSTGNLLVVQNNATTRFLIKGNGDIHATNTVITALDDYDDVALLRTLDRETTLSGMIESSWDKFINYNRSHLEEAGVIVGDFISMQGHQRLTSGAIWQLHERLAEMEAKIGNV